MGNPQEACAADNGSQRGARPVDRLKWPRLLVALGIVAGAIAVARRFGDPQTLLSGMQLHGLQGAAILGSLYVLATLALVPANPLIALIGFLYGPLLGSLILLPANLIATALGFAIGRFLARDWVRQIIARHPRLGLLDAAIEKSGFKIVLLLRLSPFFPFGAFNYALSLTRVRFRSFLSACFLGALPGTILWLCLGSLSSDVSSLFHAGSLPGRWKVLALLIGIVVTLAVLAWSVRILKQQLPESMLEPSPAVAAGPPASSPVNDVAN